MLKKILTPSDCLDLAKKKAGLDSDNKLDKALGYKASFVTLVRRKGVLPSKEKMIELAHLIGMPEDEALCLLGIWEAKKKKENHAAQVYEKMLSVLTSAGKAAAVIAGITLASFGSFDTQAGTLPVHPDITPGNTVYYGKLYYIFMSRWLS